MQDVARASGVSVMTVSNVINGRNVSPETRGRVLEAIDTLGYRVNLAARNLRKGRTGTIGLAVPEVDSPYFAQLAARIITHAEAAGFRVAIEQTGLSREKELTTLAQSRNYQYDGVILSVVGLGKEDAALLQVDFPAVILGERIFDGPLDHLAMANVEGARAATEHLLGAGRRRIAMIAEVEAEPDSGVASLRFHGYRDALLGAGIAVDPDLVVAPRNVTMPAGRDAVRELLDRGHDIDAVFCLTDTLAIGAMRGLADAGLRVPDDVMVIGFDDIIEARFTIPSLSTVDPGHDFMARTAVEMLIERIERKGTAGPPREVISPARVVARESTRPAADRA
ncbi:LacI family DNA-binding transcriptional regulator [Actinotalea sp. K2]|uniref:LacI family DNA-binding transcriptional regulator n=1 Tax=Actinotalea sp. K2 TaxID=2939438 RepID=UPI002017D83F|nr:LacI family DNA-binding transcriptional regulator [Actinotalea sp. K2]MCL3861710.1 LacI family transcriptional regulator [Actinotalea sp. K2]